MSQRREEELRLQQQKLRFEQQKLDLEKERWGLERRERPHRLQTDQRRHEMQLQMMQVFRDLANKQNK